MLHTCKPKRSCRRYLQTREGGLRAGFLVSPAAGSNYPASTQKRREGGLWMAGWLMARLVTCKLVASNTEPCLVV